MRLTERIPCHSQSETTLEDFHVGGLPSQNVTNPHGHSISTLRRLQLSSIQGPNHRCWCPYLTKSRRGLGGALRWVDLPSLAGKRDGSIMKYLRIEHSDRLWLDEISMNINKTYNHATPHQHRDSWHYFHWKLEALLHITHYISVYSRHDQFAVVCWHQSNRMAWGSFICLVCVHQWKKCLHLFQGKEGAQVCQIGRQASNAGSQNENMKRCFSNLAARMASCSHFGMQKWAGRPCLISRKLK